MKLQRKIIKKLKEIDEASGDLGLDLFLFTCKLKPNLCVELIIHNSNNEVLMTRRNDPIFGVGWHFPGGVVRFKESTQVRLQKVANQELRSSIKHIKLIGTEEDISNTRHERQHEIRLIYECAVENDPADGKDIAWFSKLPNDTIETHKNYSKYLFLHNHVRIT